jgi:hypothetical protein
MTQYNFNNPEIQQKAQEKALTAERPSTYSTERTRLLALKESMMKEEIAKTNFFEEIRLALPNITNTMIESAKTDKGVADRKIILKIIGMFEPKKKAVNIDTELAMNDLYGRKAREF